MSFTDQKARIATVDDVKRGWGAGGRLRCTLCGHFMLPGDSWRWVAATHVGLTNPTVCGGCDDTNENVIERWRQRVEEFNSPKFWALRDDS